ncbi:hypothetical protein CONPUDRAFT_105309 [Coniophora puteana RWD-64-598 SS2]|uniref:BTB domain-containing protein n=1 Tax=Coniophora puteana (strain RWD-64-598) TaxID=741705 RepID=A0A5M3MMQ0_CONPW|nr:uncharacterized protein CONPUDRAFT_105309 [Coniophora puteana RWD-64-598 SS2]EIW80316.1 hypothetical protein CONPUDRAFT_105309 [Coniophora puteana RWD-64-598 SS2]
MTDLSAGLSDTALSLEAIRDNLSIIEEGFRNLRMPSTADDGIRTSSVNRDEIFYFSDVIIRVESTLYKVPRHILSEHSHVFRDMFALPSGNQPAEGLSDDNPIVLQGVTSYDFRQLLRVLYARAIVPSALPVSVTNPARSQLSLARQEWSAVLKLSHQWEMSTIHQFAIGKMSSLAMDPTDKLALALKYNIDVWIKPALNDLAKRSRPMTKRDVDLLGLGVVLKIAEVRESIIKCPFSGVLTVGTRQADQLDFGTRIEAVFPEHFPPPQPHTESQNLSPSGSGGDSLSSASLFGFSTQSSNNSITAPSFGFGAPYRNSGR